ncbi:MAG: hypothetical protein H6Q17_413 [Bacteroidetes bacterium]|nr:hypothetical protein [Bacteroidota bacterium]
MNQIALLKFDFTMQNEDFARSLYGRWDSFFASGFERVADKVLTLYSPPNEHLEIELLELDLGTILEDELDEQFPLRLREKLEEALSKCVFDSTVQQSVKRISGTENGFQLLCRFLLNGSMSWNAQQQYKNLSQLFMVVLQSHSRELKQFLLTYGHYSSLQQRLVYQFQQPELEAGVRLLAPGESRFIVSYVQLLQQKYKLISKPALPETDHRLAVWKVVYAYLLTNRSSYFNKKSFVAETITQLAGEYNTSYQALLELFSSELSNCAVQENLLPELFQVLGELQKELDQRQFVASAQNAARLYKSLALYLQGQLSTGFDKQNRKALLRMLSQPDSCRVFLQLLCEEEIIQLVSVIIPQESDFIISYAHSLDMQKEQGAMQGRAGGEFVKLKWQLIFTALFENTGASFNRKYFVYGVLKKLAAHYNLMVLELLQYFHRELEQFSTDHSLAVILRELCPEQQARQQNKNQLPVENTLLDVKRMILTAEKFTQAFKTELWQQLSDAQQRKKLVMELTEDEQRHLVRHLLKNDSAFILSYAANLDTQQERGMLEGKAGSEFRQLKWIFIWTVLSESYQTAFNQKQFVSQVLRNMAAHYHLTHLELLSYFYSSKNSSLLTPEIKDILQSLYFEEQEEIVFLILETGDKKNIHQLLMTLYPGERAFIRSLALWLEKSVQPALVISVTRQAFNASIWKIIFRLLLKNQQTVNLSHKRFLELILLQIAEHYHLVSDELLNPDILRTTPAQASPELIRLLHDIYREQTAKHNSGLRDEASLIMAKAPETFEEKTIYEVLQARDPEKIYRLLATFSPWEHDFIRDYVLWLNTCCRQDLLPSVTEYDFSRVIWNIVFSYLLKNRRSARFSRKEFLEIVLEQLATHYRLSQDKLLQLQVLLKRAAQPLPELNQLLHDIQLDKNQKLREELPEQEHSLQIIEHEILEEKLMELTYIDNAGLALLAPYLPRLFDRLQLTEASNFKDRDAQIRAMFLLQYLVFEHTEFPEYQMTFNKLLTGFQTGVPIPLGIELTETEKETADGMLRAVIQHWKKLSNTSVAGLRQSFLQREGKICAIDEGLELTVESKAYDMLLDSVPWSYSVIKFSWMKDSISVKWR